MSINNLKVPSALRAEVSGPIIIDVTAFPDAPRRAGDGPPCTIANVRHLLQANGVTVRYDVIRKRVIVTIPWLAGTTENIDAVALTHIISMASACGMPTGHLASMVDAIADENAFNPVADWIHSKPWDGEDRLQAFYDTITPVDGYPLELRNTLLRRWLLSAVAAALLPHGFRSRGVLTLQGKQGIGKTSWGMRLINDTQLAREVIKTDLHLDGGDKDSLIAATGHFLVEIGELESSLRRDVSRLKGFITSGTDKIRRPYGKVAVETQRRTVFYATVNAGDFLIDTTGNTRFWTIACERIDHRHDIDMQQVFAQCAVLLQQEEQWWLTNDEETLLESQNGQHQAFSLVRDELQRILDLDAPDTHPRKAVTASELLVEAGLHSPSNAQAKECAAYLRGWFGEPRRVNGRMVWRVPIRADPGTAEETSAPPPKSKFD